MNAARRGKTVDAVLARFGPVPTDMRAYVVRGTDLQWRAKRLCDGEVISTDESRGAAKTDAERQGYLITK